MTTMLAMRKPGGRPRAWGNERISAELYGPIPILRRHHSTHNLRHHPDELDYIRRQRHPNLSSTNFSSHPSLFNTTHPPHSHLTPSTTNTLINALLNEIADLKDERQIERRELELSKRDRHHQLRPKDKIEHLNRQIRNREDEVDKLEDEKERERRAHRAGRRDTSARGDRSIRRDRSSGRHGYSYSSDYYSSDEKPRRGERRESYHGSESGSEDFYYDSGDEEDMGRHRRRYGGRHGVQGRRRRHAMVEDDDDDY